MSNSVGKPIKGVEIILSNESGQPVKRGEKGIIHINTSKKFNGYITGGEKL